jgi:hypothetical protein
MYILCSYTVYRRALDMGLRARAFGGGATERCYEIHRDDLVWGGWRLTRVRTYDDIPRRGAVEWEYVVTAQEVADAR